MEFFDWVEGVRQMRLVPTEYISSSFNKLPSKGVKKAPENGAILVAWPLWHLETQIWSHIVVI